MPTQQQLDDLRWRIIPAAVACEAATGLPREVSVAQCIIESSWLAHCPGNNCFGIKQRAGRARKLVVTTEWFSDAQLAAFMELNDGRWAKPTGLTTGPQKLYRVGDWFAAYDNLTDCFADHAALITAGHPYVAAWASYQRSHDVLRLIDGIAAAGYATAPGYAQTLISVLRSPAVSQAIADSKAPPADAQPQRA